MTARRSAFCEQEKRIHSKSFDELGNGAEEPRTQGPLVLIIDDDPDVADATAMLLDVMGYRTLVAADATGAREQLARSKDAPKAIICDLHLSRGCNGVDALREVRAAANRTIPAILVTGDTTSSTAGLLQDVEACHLLSKPADTDELLRLLRSFL